jgi:hypothetical protein
MVFMKKDQKALLEEKYRNGLLLEGFPHITNCLGKCSGCIDAQVDLKKDYCDPCNQLYESLMTHSSSYCNSLV